MLTEWRGKHNFFWRIKLKAIELITSLSPNNHLIYLDGDTCLKGDLNEIRQLLDSGVPLMHKDEGPLSAMNGKSLAMWNQIKSRSYGGVPIEERLHEWNAGVVAIPANMLSKVASQALTICDEMLAESVEPIVIVQYSLAVSLFYNAGQMVEAKRWIIHYWHNKYEWSRYIALFFARSYSPYRSFEDELLAIRNTNYHALQRWLEVKRVVRKYFSLIK